jgi:hypothetical protein
MTSMKLNVVLNSTLSAESTISKVPASSVSLAYPDKVHGHHTNKQKKHKKKPDKGKLEVTPCFSSSAEADVGSLFSSAGDGAGAGAKVGSHTRGNIQRLC